MTTDELLARADALTLSTPLRVVYELARDLAAALRETDKEFNRIFDAYQNLGRLWDQAETRADRAEAALARAVVYERENGERVWSGWAMEVLDEAAKRVERAEAALVTVRGLLERTAAELSGWVNDGSVLCGCRQHPDHGGIAKQDWCSSHAVLAAALDYLKEK